MALKKSTDCVVEAFASMLGFSQYGKPTPSHAVVPLDLAMLCSDGDQKSWCMSRIT